MTAKELVDEINAATIYTPHALEDVIDTDGLTEIVQMDHDEHPWYVLGTVIFQVGDEFFGVYGPIMLKSENASYDDIARKCVAFEMEQVPSVTYKRKTWLP